MEVRRARKSEDNLEEEKESGEMCARRTKTCSKPADGGRHGTPPSPRLSFGFTCLYGSEGWDGGSRKRRDPLHISAAHPLFSCLNQAGASLTVGLVLHNNHHQ